jgi:glycosyltransferase involved in cell wall biosynthesis
MIRPARRGTPLRVVYHLESDAFGGVERHLITLLKHLDRRRFEPVVLGQAPDALRRDLTDLEVEMVSLPEITSKWDWRAWKASLGAVRRLRPDVYHGMQSHSFSGQYALASAVIARVPLVIVTNHMPTPSSNRRQAWLGTLLRRGVDLQIVPGEWTRSELGRMGQLARHTVVVHQLIEKPDFVSRARAREILGVDPDATVVGGLMRLEAYKRPDLVVELAQTVPGVTVVLFGDGPERNALVKLADGTDVVLTGFMADANRYVRALDVFVHPCPADNQPLAVLEAMVGGVPVVVADEGGSATMVDHERTGLLAEATSEGMSEAVNRLLVDESLAAHLAAAGAAKVQSECDPRSVARRVEALYEQGSRSDDTPGTSQARESFMEQDRG